VTGAGTGATDVDVVATVPAVLVGRGATDDEVEQPRSVTVANVHTAHRARWLDTTEV